MPRPVVIAALLLSLGLAAPAQAGVSLSVPAVVATGDRVTARGHAPGARSVALEQRRGGRWVTLARARGGRFALAWRAPARRTVLTLRVASLRNGRRVAVSRARRVAVSAVEVLRPSQVLAAPPPGSAGTLRLSGRAPVSAGEHVAFDVGAETPHGLLVRVVARRQSGRQTVLETVPASLVDVVPEGRLAAGSLRPARARAAAAAARFRPALSCGGGASGELRGSFAATLDPLFELSWARGRVRKVRAAATISGQAELIARIGGRSSCSLAESPVARWDAPPLRFAVGPIPVVIVPRTDLYVSAAAQASAAVETGVAGAITATAGLGWDGDVEPSGSFGHSLVPIAPTAQVDASIGARLVPSVTFLMYGQAGPRFDLATGLQFDASAGTDPWWTLAAPVELTAGLRVPAFTSLEIAQRPVFSRSFPIAQAEAGPAAEAQRRRAVAAWDSPRTDVDLHVWDGAGNHAWFRDKAAIPGALLSSDDTDGFGPEFLDETGAAGRTFTYGLCYFDDHGLGSTAVTVRLTDPDGRTRESVHTLRVGGDSVLLGSSPAGAGFTPAPGWCSPR